MLTGYNFPFNRVQDGYFHDALPSTQVRRGGLANVPILTGLFMLSREEHSVLTRF